MGGEARGANALGTGLEEGGDYACPHLPPLQIGGFAVEATSQSVLAGLQRAPPLQEAVGSSLKPLVGVARRALKVRTFL